MNRSNEPPRERPGYIDGVGMVRVTTAQCICGRPVQPSDFQVIDDDQFRVVCPACHRDVLSVGLT
jgi:hypothetical protein